MTSRHQTVNVEKPAWRNYFKKSQDFLRSAKESLEGENWNAAGLAAVHSAISANDALLVYFGGIKSSSKSHDDAIQLSASLIDKEGIKEALNHLRRIIAKKNLIEYEGKCFCRDDAQNIVLQSDRFFSWTKHTLPKV